MTLKAITPKVGVFSAVIAVSIGALAFKGVDLAQVGTLTPGVAVTGQLDPAAAWIELPTLPENITLLTDLTEPPIDLTDRGRLLATLLPVTVDSSVEPFELENLFAARAAHEADRPFGHARRALRSASKRGVRR